MSYDRSTEMSHAAVGPYAPQLPTGMGLDDAALLDTRRMEEGYTVHYETVEDAILVQDKSKVRPKTVKLSNCHLHHQSFTHFITMRVWCLWCLWWCT